MNVLTVAPERLERLRRICLALPGAEEKVAWGDPTWRIRDRIFAMQKGNYEGGRPSVWLKAPEGARAVLIENEPQLFFVPPYVGHKGWVGIFLDVAKLDWAVVGGLIEESYRAIAPRRALAQRAQPLPELEITGSERPSRALERTTAKRPKRAAEAASRPAGQARSVSARSAGVRSASARGAAARGTTTAKKRASKRAAVGSETRARATKKRSAARPSKGDMASLLRPVAVMPPFVKSALRARGLGAAYRARPPYQRNDYISWITRAKREATRQKRLEQMLTELEGGELYMNMSWRPARQR